MNGSGAGGAVPVINILDYLQPSINRPDLYYQRAYPIQQGGGGNVRSLMNSDNQSIQRTKASGEERSPAISLYYTIGLILVSAFIFLTLAAWSNTLLSWYDTLYVSPALEPVTQSRLYFALTMTAISFFVVIFLLLIWYYFTIQQGH